MVKTATVASVIIALIVGIAGTYGFFSVTGPAAQKKIFEGQEIKIGYVMSITGRVAAFGKGAQNALRMADEEINNAGGILGGKVLPVIEDDQSSADVAAAAVEKLITGTRL